MTTNNDAEGAVTKKRRGRKPAAPERPEGGDDAPREAAQSEPAQPEPRDEKTGGTVEKAKRRKASAKGAEPAKPVIEKEPRRQKVIRPQQLSLDATARAPDLTYALSLYAPRSEWVADGKKTIENRPWAPYVSVIDTVIAIHATLDVPRDRRSENARRVADVVRATGVTVPEEPVRGAIIAVVTVKGYVVKPADILGEPVPASHPTRSPWFIGPCGWILEGARRLPRPIPCGGGQKLWRLTDEQRAEIRSQLGPQAGVTARASLDGGELKVELSAGGAP